MINFDPKHIDYLNESAVNLLSKIQDFSNDSGTSKRDLGSIRAKPISLNIEHNETDSPKRFSTTNYKNESVDWFEYYKGQKYGFESENYKEFIKLVESFSANKFVKESVSFGFLIDKSLDWFSEIYINKKIENDYYFYLKTKISESIKTYKIHFPVNYLEIDKTLYLGDAEIHYYSEKQISFILSESLKKSTEQEKQKAHELLQRELQGQVFISCNIKAEKEKAKEISYEECSLVIDILKICSAVINIPDYVISFDIDRKALYSLSNKIFSIREGTSTEDYELSIHQYVTGQRYYIDDIEFKAMCMRNLQKFDKFLKIKNNINTELKRLIFNSIKMFATAVSDKNLNRRVVQLFTILESLLLKGDNEAIMESVCKYCSKLVKAFTNKP